MNKDFYQRIRDHEKTINELHTAVHTTFKNKSKNPLEWKMACEKFHGHTSSLQMYFQKIYDAKNFNDAELLEFVVCFLEIDPFFFRSGYLKEIMLRKLKRTPLDANNSLRMKKVMIDAVMHRGHREFRDYCKLSAFIYDAELLEHLSKLLKTGNEKQKSRAKCMLDFLTDKKHITQVNVAQAG